MPLFGIDPWWNDFYTIGGFIAGIIGTIVTLGGFWISIRQIQKTRHAAEAAEEAASKTLTESKESYKRFVGAYASRLLSDLESVVIEKDWKMARIRCLDLAELIATIPHNENDAIQAAINQEVTDLRDFGQVFADMLAGSTAKWTSTVKKDKWNPLLQLLHSRLDQLKAPF